MPGREVKYPACTLAMLIYIQIDYYYIIMNMCIVTIWKK